MKEKSKTNKLFSGLSIQTVITAIQGILEISLFAIMSRLLSKADFGYYAALMGIMNVFLSLSEAGLGSAIIQKKNASEGHVNTAFTLSILLGLLFSAIIFIFAPQISIIVADKSLAMPMRIVSITLLLNSLNSIGNSILLKRLNFKRVGIISIVSYFVSGIIGIILALKGFGLYSIVAYVVLYPLFVCLLLFSTSVKIPKLTINKNEIRSIVSFGGWLTAGVIVNNITHQLDKLLLSKWISVEALGSYNRPAGFVNNIASKINGIFDTVLFPILSDLQEDSFKVKDVFLRAINLLNSFSVILSALFFFNAELIITLFFGEKWIELVPILRIVSIGVIFNVNGRLVDCFFRSLALVKIGCFLRFVSAVITLVCLYIGAQFDIFGVAVCLVLANILNILTKVFVLAKKIRCNLGDLLSSWSRAMIAVVPVAILGLIFIIWIPKNIFSEFVFVIIIFITILIEFIYFPQLIGREYYNRIHPVIIAQLTKYFLQNKHRC